MSPSARRVVARCRDRLEAELAAGMLRDHGIEAACYADDAGGLRPDLGAAAGVRVEVEAADEELALALLALPTPLSEEDSVGG